MNTLLAALNLVLALISVRMLYRRLRLDGVRISTAALLIILVTNVLGLSFMPFVLAAGELRTGNVELPFDSDAYLHQVLGALIVMAGSYWLTRYSYRRKCPMPRRLRETRHPVEMRVVGTLILFVGLYLWAIYMVQGNGLELALNTRFDHYNFDRAAAHRAEVDTGIRTGEGYYRALVASFAVLPLAAAVLRMTGRRGPYFIAVWSMGLVLSMLFAISLRQKAPGLVVLLCYVSIIAVGVSVSARLRHGLSRWLNRQTLLAGLLTILLLLALFYRVTEGETFLVSLQQAIGRVFVTPGAAAHQWYRVFPSRLPYRGIAGVFFVQSPAAATHEDVTVVDVAKAATGAGSSNNASFVAVGWSGAGYWGVALATAALMLLLRLADYLTNAMADLPRHLAFCVFIPAFLPLTSSALSDVILIGSLPAVIALAAVLKSRGPTGHVEFRSRVT